MTGGPRGPARHEEFGHSTVKVPPYWEPGFETRGYPFRVWLRDLDIWEAGTELKEEQRAPAVVQRLGGAARELLREVEINDLREGRTDPNTGVIESGMTVLKRGLTSRFGQFYCTDHVPTARPRKRG